MAEPTATSLASLAVSPGSLVPPFGGARRAYAVSVPASVDRLTVTAVPVVPGSPVAVAGRRTDAGRPSEPVELPVGRSLVEVVVSSPDGLSRSTTTIKVLRAQPTPDWEKLLASALFSPRDSAGEIVHAGRMWILGGYTPELTSDVWWSSDGRSWARAGSVPTAAGINVPVAFSLAGRMWVSSNDGRLYSSADGESWSLEPVDPPWGGRYCAGCTVHDGRAWVMGGMRAGRAWNDVWSSSDGLGWVEETPAAEWSPRQLFGNVASHAGRLWVVGGGITTYEPFRSYRDVWCSEDGRRWTKVADEAPWPGRIWSSCAAWRGRLWLLGGFRAQPTWQNWRDVWYSEDGAEWRELECEHVWEPRHEISTFVFDRALWVVAGNSWPLKNDVWRLRIDGLAFVSQPPIEELAGLEYRYRARAEFAEAPGPLRYRLAASPGWLRIEPDTGIVRGRPPAAGDYQVAVEARSPAGETAVQRYTLHVSP